MSELTKPIAWEEVRDHWNSCFPTKKVLHASAHRRYQLQRRAFEGDDLWQEKWREIISTAAESKYLQSHPWMTLDFLLQDKLGYSARILEKEFSNDRQQQPHRLSAAVRKREGPAAGDGDFKAFEST